MRPLVLLLLAAGLVPAQDEAWTVERPPSEPSGEPVRLAWSLEPGWAHRLELRATSVASSSVLGATKVEVGLAYAVNVLARNEDETVDYEMPLTVTRLEIDGENGLPDIASLLDGASVTGKLDKKGRLVKGSLQARDLGPLGPQVGDWLGNVFPPLPDDPVRKGEVWESDPKEYAVRLGAGVDDEPTGAVYSRLVQVDAEVAVIETVFAITLTEAESLRLQGASGKSTLRIRGKTVLHLGRDGYLRTSETTIANEVSMEGAPPLRVTSKGRIQLTGTRTRIAKPTDDGGG